MNRPQPGSSRPARHLLLGCILAGSVLGAQSAAAASAGSLHALHAESAELLAEGPFDRPLRVTSHEIDGRLQGEILARIDQPYERVAALADPAHWCELLILLPNIRQCRVAGDGVLALRFARRFDQPLRQTYAVEFDFRREPSTEDELQVVLEAASGPFGTGDYRLQLGAVAVEDAQTFVRVRYGYSYGLTARLGAQAYLATRGRGKLGFTVTGVDGAGRPRYIGGLRGAIERNAMRLYLAVDAYLDSLELPAEERHERSLRLWLEQTGAYSQLAEDDPEAYFQAKRTRR